MNNNKKSDGLGRLMTFSEGPDAHAQNIGRRGVKGGGVYSWGEIKSSCRDPILCIVMDVTQNVMHSKSQIQKISLLRSAQITGV